MAERRMLTNSTIRAFMRCRRRYDFTYNQRLEPVATGAALKFGTVVHECLRAFYVERDTLFTTIVGRWRDEYIASVEAHQDAFAAEGVDTTKVDAMAELALGIMHRYVVQHGGDFDEYEVLAAELPFRLPLRVPCNTCSGAGSKVSGDPCDSCNGSGLGRRSPLWDFGGTVDLVLRDRQHGLVWICEHKTTVETDADRYMSKLVLDSQPRGYVWAVAQLAEQNGWGKLGGILYNVLRKKVPADPVTTQCKRCKGTGTRTKAEVQCEYCNATGVGGISKAKGIDTTMEKFIATVKAHPHLDLSDYHEVIGKLQARGERFFWRRHHPVGAHDLREWQLDVYDVAREIGSTDRFYRNLDACDLPGRLCPFRRICLEDNEFARRNFTVRDRALPEMDTPPPAAEFGF